MDIVVVYDEPKFSMNLDFLKGKFNCACQLVHSNHIDESLPRLKKDFIIYFHSLNNVTLSNLDTLKRLKKLHPIPLLTVIPKNEELLEAAFLQGADEVVYYPFSHQEFIIRTRALIKRKFQNGLEIPKQFMIKDLYVNTENYQICRHDKTIPITKLEFSILITLASNPNKVFMKKELYEMIWQDQYYDNGNVLNVHIRRLRKKIEINPDKPTIIETKWGIGYKINMK